MKRTPKTKRKVKVDRACQCHPTQKPTFPIISHSIACPVRRRYTDNGRMIAELMHSKKIKGSPKDFVIMIGRRLIDFHGTYEIRGVEGGQGVPGVSLVHKRELDRIVGAKEAGRFWRRGWGRIRAV